ncbi:hypothetical protein IscW_ISCW024784 [Ixodes scapularis]|uniref:Uncharacterized protein n=1 Tax=Ixodes scapularis TaxID=6945 RepID=B7QD23_IXOSC|nr:hypothetical protein IscW_ISCW024784 [Ixodes scapularis]|eukprot:XP_002413437.1 hypothetical protein IscW_ISCW024784 [Ixodes scapularis]
MSIPLLQGKLSAAFLLAISKAVYESNEHAIPFMHVFPCVSIIILSNLFGCLLFMLQIYIFVCKDEG